MLLKQNFWLLILPLLFIPSDILLLEKNAMGTIQVMDIFLLLTSPFWLLKFIIRKKNTNLKNLRRVFLIFIFICFTSVIIIQLKFNYVDNFYFNFSLLKFLKFSIYVLFGLFIMDRFQNKDLVLYNRNKHIIIIVISLIIITNFLAGNIGSTNVEYWNDFSEFKSYTTANGISVTLAILSSSIIPYLFTTISKFKLIYLGLIIAALIMSGGRGGFVAFAVALIYYFLKYLTLPNKVKTLFLGCFAIGVLYIFIPEVKFQIDRTIFPDQDFLRYNNMGAAGLDDGKRISGFFKSFPDWYNQTLFGYGFFHRGGLSDLKSWGSHNFYLQMLLEVGLIGFISLLYVFSTIRKKIIHLQFVTISNSMSLGLISAFVGGLSGEYFYGSEALMAFMILIIPIGALSDNKRYDL
jgi:O-antigen ligase